MTPEQQARYSAALHRRQSAVALAESYGNKTVVSHKHLRVGIDSALADQRALAELLIQKGIFTKEEYTEAIVQAAEREADSWVQKVRTDHNLPDTVTFA